MKKKIIKAFCLFSIFLVFVTLLQYPQKSYSKYQTVVMSNNSNLEVASFVFLSSADTSLPLTLNESLYPGISAEFNFTIQNYNEDIISDVTLNYIIEITKTNNLPIEIEIYRNDILMDYSTTNIYTFPKNIKSIDNYKIIIKWNEYSNDYSYANLSDSISLNIVATQVD